MEGLRVLAMQKTKVMNGYSKRSAVSRLFRWGSTIHGQITGVILACLVIAFVIGSTLERRVREEYNAPDLEGMSARVTAFALVLAKATPQERERAYGLARRELDGLVVLPERARAQIERGISGELGS